MKAALTRGAKGADVARGRGHRDGISAGGAVGGVGAALRAGGAGRSHNGGEACVGVVGDAVLEGAGPVGDGHDAGGGGDGGGSGQRDVPDGASQEGAEGVEEVAVVGGGHCKGRVASGRAGLDHGIGGGAAGPHGVNVVPGADRGDGDITARGDLHHHGGEALGEGVSGT